MRHLTASEKIAILENRVAQLEKQAILDEMRQQVSEGLQAFKGVQSKVGQVFKKAGGPKRVAKEYGRVSKTPEFKKALAALRKEVGSNPVKQVKFILEERNNAQRRMASMNRVSFDLMEFILNPEILIVACLLVGSIVVWVLNVTGIKKLGSQNKEAFFDVSIGTAFWMSLVTFIVGWFMGKSGS